MKKKIKSVLPIIMPIVYIAVVLTIGYLVANHKVETIVGYECGFIETIYYAWVYSL